MKKLHKKIGAVALAGMIIAGGVGASKIDSHAAYSNRSAVVDSIQDLSKLSKGALIDLDYIYSEFLKGSEFEIIAVSDNRSLMNGYINKKFSKEPDLIQRLSRVPMYAFYGRDFMDILHLNKKKGHKISHIKFGDAYLLVSSK